MAYSPDLFVTKDTPPTFWYHTFDDKTVPVEQGLRFYEALVKAGVPAEETVSGPGTGDGRAACQPDGGTRRDKSRRARVNAAAREPAGARAAVATGVAPQGYAQTDAARKGLDELSVLEVRLDLAEWMDRLGIDSAFAERDGVILPFLLHRAITEDRVLQAELPGYRDYATRVRWRVLPGIW